MIAFTRKPVEDKCAHEFTGPCVETATRWTATCTNCGARFIDMPYWPVVEPPQETER